jgi:hypothetical protein
MVNYFGEWLLAVVEHWEILVTIGIIPFGLDIVDKYFECKMPKSYYAIFLGIALFLAMFKAWDEKREKLSESLAALDALKKPIISGELREKYAAATGDNKQDTIATVRVHIKNLGAPTALEGFSFKATSKGHVFEGAFIPPPRGVANIFAPNGKVYAILDGKDHLSNKTGSQAIQANVPADCWFGALFIGLPAKEFIAAGTSYTLSFRDVATGELHEIKSSGYGADTRKAIDLDKLQEQTR